MKQPASAGFFMAWLLARQPSMACQGWRRAEASGHESHSAGLSMCSSGLWAVAQPLTAPAVSPVMIWRAAMKVKISGGMAIKLPMAMTRPQSTPMSVM